MLQKHLECLKKEKHNLFQQLKVVLHDEDEKKKAEEQKLYVILCFCYQAFWICSTNL